MTWWQTLLISIGGSFVTRVVTAGATVWVSRNSLKALKRQQQAEWQREQDRRNAEEAREQ